MLAEAVHTSAGARPRTVPSREELAAQFPTYEIGELLGQGGMGLVFRAEQRTLRRTVALKLLAAEIADEPGFAERFAREARVLASLTHPNIVTVFEFGRQGEWFYFAMELVEGASLRQLLRAKTLSPRESLAIVVQMCDALQYAHDSGVVHRDIKPENVLVDRAGRVKILDFGLSKMSGAKPGDTLTRTDQIMGTPHYMAPEQWERPASVDHRADIYALGVVFYELLTGELPLGRFEPPSHKVSIDVRLDEVVLRTLAKEPDRRYQHASDVKIDVEHVGSTPGAHSPDAARAVFPSAPPATIPAMQSKSRLEPPSLPALRGRRLLIALRRRRQARFDSDTQAGIPQAARDARRTEPFPLVLKLILSLGIITAVWITVNSLIFAFS
jgi:serine/threonine protein kinase